MADEQKTEQEQQPVENKVEEVVEEKEPMVSQSEVDKIVERRLAREKSKYEKMYSGIDPEQARKLFITCLVISAVSGLTIIFGQLNF